MITCSSSTITKSLIFDKCNRNYDNDNMIAQLSFVDFDDSVYSIDWAVNKIWAFAAISNGCYLHINEIPESYTQRIITDSDIY